MPSPHSLVSKIRRSAQALDFSNKRVLLAVSGGPDSVAMLLAFTELSEPMNLHLRVATIDHGLRPDSWDDCLFVSDLSKQLGLKCVMQKVIINNSNGLEAAARKERYQSLERIARDGNEQVIATAHTLEDQVETILMRLGRGAGTRGLRGILPKRGLVARPMLEVSREEVADFLRLRQTTARQDSTNLCTDFTRNRVRAWVLPALSKSIGKQSLAAIARTCVVAQEDQLFLESVAHHKFRMLFRQTDTSLQGNVEQITKLPTALRWRVLRLAAKEMGISALWAHIHAMDEALFSSRKHPITVTLPSNLEFSASYGQFQIGRGIVSRKTLSTSRQLECIIDGPGLHHFGSLEVHVNQAIKPGLAAPGSIRIDPNSVQLPLKIRYRKPGDRFRALGGHEKKLKSFLIDKKIARHLRDSLPLLTDSSERILWIPGIKYSDAVKQGESANNSWQIEIRSSNTSNSLSILLKEVLV
jgi:tRNA(Ile)-lysidine synthase